MNTEYSLWGFVKKKFTPMWGCILFGICIFVLCLFIIEPPNNKEPVLDYLAVAAASFFMAVISCFLSIPIAWFFTVDKNKKEMIQIMKQMVSDEIVDFDIVPCTGGGFWLKSDKRDIGFLGQ